MKHPASIVPGGQRALPREFRDNYAREGWAPPPMKLHLDGAVRHGVPRTHYTNTPIHEGNYPLDVEGIRGGGRCD